MLFEPLLINRPELLNINPSPDRAPAVVNVPLYIDAPGVDKAIFPANDPPLAFMFPSTEKLFPSQLNPVNTPENVSVVPLAIVPVKLADNVIVEPLILVTVVLEGILADPVTVCPTKIPATDDINTRACADAVVPDVFWVTVFDPPTFNEADEPDVRYQ